MHMYTFYIYMYVKIPSNKAISQVSLIKMKLKITVSRNNIFFFNNSILRNCIFSNKHFQSIELISILLSFKLQEPPMHTYVP